MSKQGEKRSTSKRNMKEYGVLIWVFICRLWHQFGFWDRFGIFFSKFSKNEPLSKSEYGKIIFIN